MFYNDHSPPHFHAVYGGDRASFSIQPFGAIEGEFPSRATGLVKEWTRIHEAELMADWERARQHLPLERIAPLD